MLHFDTGELSAIFSEFPTEICCVIILQPQGPHLLYNLDSINHRVSNLRFVFFVASILMRLAEENGT
jgi:hypothetical protein